VETDLLGAAIEEIGDQVLAIREQSGPDSLFWLGSTKFNNEQSYLFRKRAALWGTNNVDHQTSICHSTTVAGVANTWGYGAMINSYNDIHNSKAMLIIGGNPAEAQRALQPMPICSCASAPAPTSPSSGACCGTSSRTNGGSG